MKKSIISTIVFVIMVFALSSCSDKGVYKKATEALDAGNYEEAVSMFSEIVDYEDSADKLKEAQKQLMFKTYSSEIEMLEKNWWVANGGSDATLNYYQFQNGTVKIGRITFDGNGKHDAVVQEAAAYEIDDTKITTQTPSGDPLEISYTVENEKIVLDDGAYFSPDMIKEGLQGIWKYKYFDYNSTLKMYSRGEHNIQINGDIATYEYASLSAFDYSSYYYYGPYAGSYDLDIGSLKGKLEGKDIGNILFYNIINGKATMLYYNHVCETTDSLPGEDGYYHLIP